MLQHEYRHTLTYRLTAEPMGKIHLTPLKTYPRCCSSAFSWGGLLELLTRRDSRGCSTGTYPVPLLCLFAAGALIPAQLVTPTIWAQPQVCTLHPHPSFSLHSSHRLCNLCKMSCCTRCFISVCDETHHHSLAWCPATYHLSPLICGLLPIYLIPLT